MIAVTVAAVSAAAVHLSAEVYALTGTNRLVSFSAASPDENATLGEIGGPKTPRGIGLDLTGSEFSLDPDHRLPQTCASGEAAIRNPASGGSSPTWACGQFATAGQSCANGQFAHGVTEVGALSCAAPATGAGTQAYATSTDGVTLAGRTSVLSKTLPAGTYLLVASVELLNRDLDSSSWGSCDMPGYSTGTHIVEAIADSESLILTSAINHAGGAVLLTCTEIQADVDVSKASLVAIRVGSIG